MRYSRLVIFVVSALMICMITPAWSADWDAQGEKSTPQDSTGYRIGEPTAPSAVDEPATQPAGERTVAAPIGDRVQIQDAVVCRDIVDRTPVGAGSVFNREVGKLYCYCRVVGVETESYIYHNWYYNGALKASVKLSVRSDNWRTYSSKTINPEWTGEWMVEILSESGTPLGNIVFSVQ